MTLTDQDRFLITAARELDALNGDTAVCGHTGEPDPDLAYPRALGEAQHLLRLLADRLEQDGGQPGRCGDHHASGVTNCTLQAGHDGAHHNGSGLTWGGES